MMIIMGIESLTVIVRIVISVMSIRFVIGVLFMMSTTLCFTAVISAPLRF